MPLVTKYIDAEDTIDLRHLVLREGKPRASSYMTGDNLESTKHIGAFLDFKCVGVLSLFLAKTEKHASPSQYQLRGMAVHPKHQQKGVGKALVAFAEKELKQKHIEVLWCNARTKACGFYKNLNFEICSDEFFIPKIGAHFVMAKSLTSYES